MVVGILIEIYGILIRRNITGLKEDGIAAIMLGIFILVSGIWVLTDSNAFSIFTTDYGGALNRNVIVFISYVSIMVLPVIFISFLQHIIRMGKRLWIINVLFILNLSVFVLLTGFKFSKNFYYVFIIIHHVLICILMAIGIVYCIR
ncbi:MAG: hypothetical protein ACI4S9_02730, partial [Christensenellales bacterium]